MTSKTKTTAQKISALLDNDAQWEPIAAGWWGKPGVGRVEKKGAQYHAYAELDDGACLHCGICWTLADAKSMAEEG